ncbi:cobyrinate a,c-diamide synthase [Carboxylicivirga taeanensis]|uniref:cobyrinate a,c-diamide synthase n=1 Tax=Carboxylicivirga taeanensis TaxID=1416875 RepID=UPI003F6E3E4D
MKRSFLIAAPSSNAGKTIITLGLIKALRKQGFDIQPFKCGPDYIDPLHHSQVAGQSSYNLDLWMADAMHVKEIFWRQMQTADIGIVEGVMGLFDGAKKDSGSSAEVARVLDLPVVLVVNAAATAYSVAPLLYGFKNFNPDVKVKGVIFNRVSGESHYQFLKEAAADAGVTSLGYVPKDERMGLESRHLGLSLTENEGMLAAVDVAANLISQHVNLDLLLSISSESVERTESPNKVKLSLSGLKFGVAHDEAFNFMYPANVDVLKEIGEVIYFSPLNDKVIPECDLLWFPGGYPELYAEQLAHNHSMLNAIRDFERQGGKLVAECGGMMYLGQSVQLKDGSLHKMLGLFDYVTSLVDMKLKLGYRSLEMEDQVFRGHEFHYSGVTVDCRQKADSIAKTARKTEIDMPVYKTENVWSSYFHIYLGEADRMQAFLKMLLKDKF